MTTLRDIAFALDANRPGPWTVRTSTAVPVHPVLPPGPVSVRALGGRFGAAGAALRGVAQGQPNVWAHLHRPTIVSELSDRLRDPMIMGQGVTGLCGPFAILVELARRDPARYVTLARELLETGRMTCPTGRVIEAEEELRQEPPVAGIAEVDWMFATAMRDDENIWEDVEGDANGLESMTFWTEQRGWMQDVLALPYGGWETCFAYGETDCLQHAEAAVKAGGVAHFLIDANLLHDGGSDHEEQAWFRSSHHQARTAPSLFQPVKVHSEDDDFPPDHWVAYLGGLNLGPDPQDDDPLTLQVWSWSRRYEITSTVGSFGEYLYAVCYGTS